MLSLLTQHISLILERTHNPLRPLRPNHKLKITAKITLLSPLYMLSKYNELFVVWLGDGWLNLGSSAYSWIYCLTALTRTLKFVFTDVVSMYSLTPVFYFVTGGKGIYRSVVSTVTQKGCMHARVLNLVSSLTTRGQSGQTGRLSGGFCMCRTKRRSSHLNLQDAV